MNQDANERARRYSSPARAARTRRFIVSRNRYPRFWCSGGWDECNVTVSLLWRFMNACRHSLLLIPPQLIQHTCDAALLLFTTVIAIVLLKLFNPSHWKKRFFFLWSLSICCNVASATYCFVFLSGLITSFNCASDWWQISSSAAAAAAAATLSPYHHRYKPWTRSDSSLNYGSVWLLIVSCAQQLH